ncbi:MAG: hypothetical protein R2794_05590 [Chitinophagales bacterium]
MKNSILIRVEPENFQQWRTEHDACRLAREEYGITDGPFYFDEIEHTHALVHLHVQDMEKARGWFTDPRFKQAAERAGNVRREIWFAQVKE